MSNSVILKSLLNNVKADAVLLTFIGRGGHVRGARTQGARRAFCQAWWRRGLAGFPHPPRAFLTPAAAVSLACFGLCERWSSRWLWGSSEHLPGHLSAARRSRVDAGGLAGWEWEWEAEYKRGIAVKSGQREAGGGLSGIRGEPGLQKNPTGRNWRSGWTEGGMNGKASKEEEEEKKKTKREKRRKC